MKTTHSSKDRRNVLFAGGRPASPLVSCLVWTPACLAVLLLASAGCRPAAEEGLDPSESVDSSQWDEEYFRLAIGNFQRLDEFGADQVRQGSVDRLNQWVLRQTVPSGWKPDPLTSTLPGPLAALPPMKSLAMLEFSRDDGYALEEAVWTRDISRWAQGDKADDLARAEAIFDWVVRNIQLEPDGGIPRQPWETLLFGRGTAVDRAWVFVLLAAQQKIDAVIVGLPREKKEKDEKGDSGNTGLRPWAIGVAAGGKLHLFEPALGLPIPGPEGPRRDDKGRLVIRPATLDQLTADPAMLERLSLDAEHPYGVTAEQIKGAVALIVASPSSLSARMALVESRLTPAEKAVLTVQPSQIAERLKKVAGVKDVGLWAHPFEVLVTRAERVDEVAAAGEAAMLTMSIGRNSPLWKGRLLQFRDQLTGEHSATAYFQRARPSSSKLAQLRDQSPEDTTPKGVAAAERFKTAYEQAKLDASYWLGLIEIRLGNFDAADEYWFFRSGAAKKNPRWASGIRYNRARLMEERGQIDDAAALYRDDAQPDSPTRHGNLLRARWLKPQVALPGTR